MNDQQSPRGLGACLEMKVFPPFRLDMVNLCLWRAKERMPLTPKAFDILRYLIERADRLVTHDELLQALWPETYVNPGGIRKYILEIRKVLGDRPKYSQFIQTLPKRGYQFVAKVADGDTQPDNPGPAHTSHKIGEIAGWPMLFTSDRSFLLGVRKYRIPENGTQTDHELSAEIEGGKT